MVTRKTATKILQNAGHLTSRMMTVVRSRGWDSNCDGHRVASAFEDKDLRLHQAKNKRDGGRGQRREEGKKAGGRQK